MIIRVVLIRDGSVNIVWLCLHITGQQYLIACTSIIAILDFLMSYIQVSFTYNKIHSWLKLKPPCHLLACHSIAK